MRHLFFRFSPFYHTFVFRAAIIRIRTADLHGGTGYGVYPYLFAVPTPFSKISKFSQLAGRIKRRAVIYSWDRACLLQSELKLFTNLREEWQRAFGHWQIFADDDASDSDADSSDDESDDDA
jgi:hypothetical protein